MAEQNKTGRSKNCGISNFPLSLHKGLACIQLKIFALFSSASLDLGLLIPALPSHLLASSPFNFHFFCPCFSTFSPALKGVAVYVLTLHSSSLFFFTVLWLETFRLSFQLSLERQAEIPEHFALHSCLFSSFNEAYYFWRVSPFLSLSSVCFSFYLWLLLYCLADPFYYIRSYKVYFVRSALLWKKNNKETSPTNPQSYCNLQCLSSQSAQTALPSNEFKWGDVL